MADQNQSPATKEDVKGIMEYLVRNDGRTSSLEKKMEKDKKEISHEFHVVAEDIKHDFKGAFKDRVEQHDDRILRLEQHTGLAA